MCIKAFDLECSTLLTVNSSVKAREYSNNEVHDRLSSIITKKQSRYCETTILLKTIPRKTFIKQNVKVHTAMTMSPSVEASVYRIISCRAEPDHPYSAP